MQGLDLVRVAAQAEKLRLRLLAMRYVMRVAMAAGAAVFIIAALAVAHFSGWLALNRSIGPLYAVLIILGLDVVLVALLAFLALRSSPGRIEREAIGIRDQARRQLEATASISSSVAPTRLLASPRAAGLLVGGLASRYLLRR